MKTILVRLGRAAGALLPLGLHLRAGGYIALGVKEGEGARPRCGTQSKQEGTP